MRREKDTPERTERMSSCMPLVGKYAVVWLYKV